MVGLRATRMGPLFEFLLGLRDERVDRRLVEGFTRRSKNPPFLLVPVAPVVVLGLSLSRVLVFREKGIL